MQYKIHAHNLQNEILRFNAGNRVYLSGCVYTARDVAHKRFIKHIAASRELPVVLNGAVIFYVGPTPHFSRLVRAAGPTTFGRTLQLLDLDVTAMTGKGERAPYVIESMKKNRTVYFSAVGGAGDLASRHIVGCREIAFANLGCEFIKELTPEEIPLIVAIDCCGNSVFWNALSKLKKV